MNSELPRKRAIQASLCVKCSLWQAPFCTIFSSFPDALSFKLHQKILSVHHPWFLCMVRIAWKLLVPKYALFSDVLRQTVFFSKVYLGFASLFVLFRLIYGEPFGDTQKWASEADIGLVYWIPAHLDAIYTNSDRLFMSCITILPLQIPARMCLQYSIILKLPFCDF